MLLREVFHASRIYLDTVLISWEPDEAVQPSDLPACFVAAISDLKARIICLERRQNSAAESISIQYKLLFFVYR